mgnify:CR=1 FL=1
MIRYKSIDFTDFYISKKAVPAIPLPSVTLHITVNEVVEGAAPGKVATVAFTVDNPDYYNAGDFSVALIAGDGDIDNNVMEVIGDEIHSTVIGRDFDILCGVSHTTGYEQGQALNIETVETGTGFIYTTVSGNFDGGLPNYLSQPNNDFGLTDALSIGAVINLDAVLGADPQTILSKGTSGTDGYSLIRKANNTVDFNLVTGASTTNYSVSSANFDTTPASAYRKTPIAGLSTSFGISAWVKRDALGSIDQIYRDNKDNAGNHRIAVFIGSDNFPICYIEGIAVNHPLAIAVDTWYHLVIDYVGSTYMRLYIDGVLLGNVISSVPASLSADGTSPVCGIGYDPDGTASYGLDGFMHQVIDFKDHGGFSQAEVDELFEYKCLENYSAPLTAKMSSGYELADWTDNVGNGAVDQIGTDDLVVVGVEPTYDGTGGSVECSTFTSTTISSSALTEGIDYELDATYDSTEGIMRLYVDRAEVAASSADPSAISIATEDLKIGKDLTGCLQLPYVANRKYSDSEISGLSTAVGLLPFYDLPTSVTDDMIGHWNVSNWNNGKNAGQELTDNTTNTNDLTDNGTVPFDCIGTNVFDSQAPHTP